ncbi:MAG: zinc-dependent metalloprotease [Micropruina sp.]|nr:zinc-dependent metalloprotease [Micropruina sp.]
MADIPAIDWSVAAEVGRRVVPPGLPLPANQVRELVAGLHWAASRATERVSEVSLLPIAAPAQTVVVDRASWIRSTAAMAGVMLAGIAEEHPPTLARRVGGRFFGAQAGLALAWVSTRILGQFDPFGQPNRLLLVAPNVVAAERMMGVDPADFRLWVCLHEQTHRFQFGAAPWLREHLIGLIGELLIDHEDGQERPGNLEPITAVMSVMEGHADVIMDVAGQGLIGSVESLRRRMEQRRDRGGLDAWLQKLIGLNIKREQYREGAAFCRAVIARAGVPGLNRVFEAPGVLPDLAELRAPERWLRRVGH